MEQTGMNNQTPDNVITLDISTVKTLQIGYQAETLFLSHAEDEQLTIKEYIGYTAYEYLGKVNANRFKTTIRYGRREGVNTKSYVEIFLPKSWHGELQLSSQYGNIITEEDWTMERFAAETTEGAVVFRTISAPRIRITTSVGPVQGDHTVGFTDIHTVSGPISIKSIDGGAKLETSSSHIYAAFHSLNNIIECITLNGNIDLTLPSDAGMKVDGISKRGEILTDIDGLEIKTKPGNIKNILGILGEKPFQNVRLSSINGTICLRQQA